MLKRARGLKRLFVDLPRQLRLAYCLLRDPRVPRSLKLAFGGSLVLIATPFVDLPEAIPFVGELDVLALTALATRLFISACPHWVVQEQEQLIVERRSVFDEDVRRGERVAVLLFRRVRGMDDIDLSGSAQASTPEPSQRSASA